MQMAEGQIIETVGENFSTDLPQGAHIQLPDPVTVNGLTAAGEQVSHGNYGEILSQLGAQGHYRLAHVPVVVADTFHQLASLVLKGFSGPGPTNITTTQIRNRTDDQLRSSIGTVQHHQFIRSHLCHAADYMHVEETQYLARGIEQRWGIVVAGSDNDVPTTGTRHAAQEAVVEFQCPVTGRAIVKYVSRNQKCLNPFGLNAVDQPVKKLFKLFVAFAAVQRPPYVPIRCMQNFHVKPVPLSGRALCLLPGRESPFFVVVS